MEEAASNLKRSSSEVEDGKDASGSAAKKIKAEDHEQLVSAPMKRWRTIVAERKAWNKKHPRCYQTRFAFFYSSEGHNGKHAFMSQAVVAGFWLEGRRWDSAYHWYNYKKARIVKLFNLTRRNGLHGDFTAQNVRKIMRVRFRDGHFVGAGEMKKILLDFEWTEEAEAAWELEVRGVLYKANFYKFTRSQFKRRQLLNTGEKFLIKACPRYCICKCGIQQDFLEAMESRENWSRNLLGRVLMLLRKHLRSMPTDPRKLHPTIAQLAAAEYIEDIDDGRNHICDTCKAWVEAQLSLENVE